MIKQYIKNYLKQEEIEKIDKIIIYLNLIGYKMINDNFRNGRDILIYELKCSSNNDDLDIKFIIDKLYRKVSGAWLKNKFHYTIYVRGLENLYEKLINILN